MMEHKNKYTKNQILIVQAHAQIARTPFLSYFPPFSPLPYTLSLPKQTFISIFSFLSFFFSLLSPSNKAHTSIYFYSSNVIIATPGCTQDFWHNNHHNQWRPTSPLMVPLLHFTRYLQLHTPSACSATLYAPRGEH